MKKKQNTSNKLLLALTILFWAIAIGLVFILIFIANILSPYDLDLNLQIGIAMGIGLLALFLLFFPLIRWGDDLFLLLTGKEMESEKSLKVITVPAPKEGLAKLGGLGFTKKDHGYSLYTASSLGEVELLLKERNAFNLKEDLESARKEVMGIHNGYQVLGIVILKVASLKEGEEKLLLDYAKEEIEKEQVAELADLNCPFFLLESEGNYHLVSYGKRKAPLYRMACQFVKETLAD